MSPDKQTAFSTERPFVGLRPFGFADHQFFFGREDQIYSLFRLLDRGHFIAVVGSSGSGKSSLVRAGLLPLLEQESAGLGGRQWAWIEMRPGDSPLANLAHEIAGLAREDGPDEEAMASVREGRIASALRRSSFGLTKSLSEIGSLDNKSVLIVVDQFEELFRFGKAGADMVGNVKWREEAAQFIQTLLEATRERNTRIHVLITMRSDFIGDCAQFYGLPEAVSATQFLVPATTRDQREQVITAPIGQAGATIEPALVEQLLNDISDELDQLPVLQHCLMRLWEEGRRGAGTSPPHLTMVHYDAIGRANGALSQHAEEVLASLAGRETAVEQMFRAIAEIDDDGRVIRRALAFDQLVAETGVEPAILREIADRFRADDCCFLVPLLSAVPALTDDMLVDVGHEALLRRWDRIGSRATALADGGRTGWLVAEEEDGRKYRALLALVEGKRGAANVTLPLGQTEEWLEWWNSRPRTPAWAERYGGKFARIKRLLDDSRQALTEDKARAARQKRHERNLRVMAALAVIVIMCFGVNYFFQERRERNLQQLSEQQTHMIFGEMTSLLNVTFENFRVNPHSYNAGLGLLAAGKAFERQYSDWARDQHLDGKSTASLDITLQILSADLQLILGQVSKALDQLDSIEARVAALPDNDKTNLLVMAEFHFHRATVERYGDLFARSRFDYQKAIEIAQRIVKSDQPGPVDDAIVEQAEKVRGSSMRVRVEVDYAAHIVQPTDANLRHAMDDQAAYNNYMDTASKRASTKNPNDCSDLSNIAGSKDEMLNHAAEVEIEQGHSDVAASVFARYVTHYRAKVNGPCEMDPLLDNILLANGEVGYARALMLEEKLDDAGKQLDSADDYYETKLKPGDADNAFALHADDQVHWVRGWLALKQNDPARARQEFDASLKATTKLIGRDPQDAREQDDRYLAMTGRTAVDLKLGDKAQATKDQDAANDALNRANKARDDALMRLPPAERDAVKQF